MSNVQIRRNNNSYYDYAGGTYYFVEIYWLFNCPHDLNALIWTNGEKIVWHLHGSNSVDGKFNEHTGYHKEIKYSNELREYFYNQRFLADKYRKCETKGKRMLVNRKFKESLDD